MFRTLARTLHIDNTMKTIIISSAITLLVLCCCLGIFLIVYYYKRQLRKARKGDLDILQHSGVDLKRLESSSPSDPQTSLSIGNDFVHGEAGRGTRSGTDLIKGESDLAAAIELARVVSISTSG